MPVLDEHDERSTAGQGADERRQRVEQGRLEMFAAEVAAEARGHRCSPTAGAERAAGTARATASSARIRAATLRARQRRPEIESRAQNLHEDAVGNAVAVRSAPRLEHAHAGCRARDAPAARTAAGFFRRPPRRPPRPPLRRRSPPGRPAIGASTAPTDGQHRASVPFALDASSRVAIPVSPSTRNGVTGPACESSTTAAHAAVCMYGATRRCVSGLTQHVVRIGERPPIAHASAAGAPTMS